MKKFWAIFFLITVVNISVARAEILPVSDFDVQKFVHSMADLIYTEEFQEERPLLLTNAAKIENTEFPEIGKDAYICQYGLKTATEPEGEIVFFIDSEEKVSALKIVGYSEQSGESATILLVTALRAAGLELYNAEFLLTNLSDNEFLASSVVWSDEMQRCFVLMAGARAQAAEGFQFMLMASDVQN